MPWLSVQLMSWEIRSSLKCQLNLARSLLSLQRSKPSWKDAQADPSNHLHFKEAAENEIIGGTVEPFDNRFYLCQSWRHRSATIEQDQIPGKIFAWPYRSFCLQGEDNLAVSMSLSAAAIQKWSSAWWASVPEVYDRWPESWACHENRRSD